MFYVEHQNTHLPIETRSQQGFSITIPLHIFNEFYKSEITPSGLRIEIKRRAEGLGLCVEFFHLYCVFTILN